MFLLHVLVGILTGIVSGCGIGGGSLLMLYLTVFMQIPTRTAAGVNLLYFLFCSPAALFSHIKNRLVETDGLWCCIAAGVACAVGGALLAANMPLDWAKRLFGVLLIYIGIRELMAKDKSPAGRLDKKQE